MIQQLSLNYGPGTLAGKISVSSPRSLIEIKATDPDPELAARIANATAQTFIDDFRSRQFVQIAQFQRSLSQQGILEDPSIIAAQASTMSSLSIVESALAPSSPSSPRKRANLAVAAVIGLLVAVLVVFVLEYFDNSIKSPDELKALTGMAVLGAVMRQQIRNGGGPVALSQENRNSAMAESYKFLRTNLEFAALDTQGIKTLLVTSSSPEEGKTTTAANLAISVAQEGQSVILVDSDLRKPAMQRVFNVRDHKGLTNVLVGAATLQEAMSETVVEGLRVIPSGPLPPDAAQVLRSSRMKEVLEELKNSADLVILDSPPLLSVTDPMLLAPLVDAVLMVVDANHTGRDTVKRGAEILMQAHPSPVGTVLNKVTARGGGYYYYYYYYHHGYYDDGSELKRDGRFGVLSKMFRRGNRRGGPGRATKEIVASILSRIRGNVASHIRHRR